MNPKHMSIGKHLSLIRELPLGWGANAILKGVRLHMSSGIVLTWPWSRDRGFIIGFARKERIDE